jgi:uncharacterized spore protein YtfJ
LASGVMMVGEAEGRHAMDVQDVIGQARDAITVKRVFGEPYEKNGITVIPAAKVQGGAGGGGGEGPEGQGKGSGSGFGVSARPAGAYVIREGQVTWQPAVDMNRAVAVGGVVAVFFLFTLRSIARARAKGRVRS